MAQPASPVTSDVLGAVQKIAGATSTTSATYPHLSFRSRVVLTPLFLFSRHPCR